MADGPLDLLGERSRGTKHRRWVRSQPIAPVIVPVTSSGRAAGTGGGLRAECHAFMSRDSLVHHRGDGRSGAASRPMSRPARVRSCPPAARTAVSASLSAWLTWPQSVDRPS